jgi:hypothetical protein
MEVQGVTGSHSIRASLSATGVISRLLATAFAISFVLASCKSDEKTGLSSTKVSTSVSSATQAPAVSGLQEERPASSAAPPGAGAAKPGLNNPLAAKRAPSAQPSAAQRLRTHRTQALAANAQLLADRKKAVREKKSVEIALPPQERQTAVREVIEEKRAELAKAMVGPGVKLDVVNRLVVDPVILAIIGKYNNDSEPFSAGPHEYRLSAGVFVPRSFLQEIAKGASPLIQDGRIGVSNAGLDATGYSTGDHVRYSLDDINAWIVGQ